MANSNSAFDKYGPPIVILSGGKPSLKANFSSGKLTISAPIPSDCIIPQISLRKESFSALTIHFLWV